MNNPKAQLNVVHQGAFSVAVGQYQTNTKEVKMLMASPTMVMRLGATHNGTKVTNLKKKNAVTFYYFSLLILTSSSTFA